MKSIQLIVVIVMMLVLSSSVMSSSHQTEVTPPEKENSPKKEQANPELKKQFGSEVKPKDITITEKEIKIRSGKIKLSQESPKELTIQSHRAFNVITFKKNPKLEPIDATSYSGTIKIVQGRGGSIRHKEGALNIYDGSVVMKDGKVVKIIKGDVRHFDREGRTLSGYDFNYDSSKQLVKSSKRFTIDGARVTAPEETIVSIDLSKQTPEIDSGGKEAIIEFRWTNEFKNKFNGKIAFRNPESFTLLDGTTFDGEFVRLKHNGDLAVVNGGPCGSELGSCVELSFAKLQRIVAKEDEKLKVSISSSIDPDKEVEVWPNVQVDKISDGSTVDLFIKIKEGEGEKHLSFDSGAPKHGEDLSDLPGKIIHKYTGLLGLEREWVFENGQFRNCLSACESKGIVYRSMIDLTDRKNNQKIERIVYDDMKKYKQYILSVSNKLGVDPKTLAATLYVEKMQYELNALRKGKEKAFQQMGEWTTFLYDLNKWVGLSVGYSHIKPNTAVKTKVKLDAIPGFKDFITANDVKTYESSPIASIKIAAGMMKVLQHQWATDPKGIPIEKRPDIVSTLYNIGYQNSKPKTNPLPGGTDHPVIVGGYLIENVNFGTRTLIVYESPAMKQFFAENEQVN